MPVFTRKISLRVLLMLAMLLVLLWLRFGYSPSCHYEELTRIIKLMSIPPILHQSWRSRTISSGSQLRWRDSWFKCLPHWEHWMWSDEDNLRLVQHHYPWFLRRYLLNNGSLSGIQKADMARYLYLHRYGGVYADLDTICVRDFQHLLLSQSLVFGGMAGPWHTSVQGLVVQNSFMASVPGHPFWMKLIMHFMEQQQTSGEVEEITGPLVMMKVLQQYIEENPPGAVKIFPPEFFNPFSWITNSNPDCKTLGAMTIEQEHRCVQSFPEAYVVQLHGKSWAGGKL